MNLLTYVSTFYFSKNKEQKIASLLTNNHTLITIPLIYIPHNIFPGLLKNHSEFT